MMNTYTEEERVFAVEPLPDITTFELAVMLKKRFHPAWWMLDVDSNADTKRRMMELPEEILRHFVLTTHIVLYKKHWSYIGGDEELSRDIVKTGRVID